MSPQEHISQAPEIPMEAHRSLIELTHRYGPELLTAALGYLSIYLINKGSSRYADLAPGMDEAEERAVIRDASRDVALGAVGMSATAFAAGNPLFAYPEAVAVIGALKPYTESLSPYLKDKFGMVKLGMIIKAAAVGVGTWTAASFAETPLETLPPMSLAALTVAFSGGVKQEIYRLLTVAGGTGLIVGSAASGINAMQDQNAVGAIMSSAFLALNLLFTRNELKEAQKIGGMKRIIIETARSIVDLFRRKSTEEKDSESD